MSTLTRSFAAGVMALSIGIGSAWAHGDMAGSPVKVMADIMIHLNHYPSDAEKQSLQKIAADGSVTEAERTLASAMINLQHAVSPADKPKVQKIIDDKATAEPVRQLASVVISLNHSPSAADKAKLKSILDQ